MRIIGIRGEKFSGKSALAAELLRCVEPGEIALEVAFADPLKDAAMRIYGLTEAQVHDPRLKETPVARLATPEFPVGLTPRVILQRLGTEVGRFIAQDTWVWAWQSTVARCALPMPMCGGQACALVVTPDVRFPNEAAAIRAAGGQLVRIVRPGRQSTDTHASETEAASIPVDIEIINDAGLAELRAAARTVYGWLGQRLGARRDPDVHDVVQFRCGVGAFSVRGGP